MGPGWDGKKVGSLTLSQIHNRLPLLRQQFGQALGAISHADKMARARHWCITVGGDPDPTDEHIAQVAERL